MALKLLLLLLERASASFPKKGSLRMQTWVSSGTAALTFDHIPHHIASVVSYKGVF